MKKILILNHGLHISGVSKSLVNLANSLVKEGFEVHIKLCTYNLELLPELNSNVKISTFLPLFNLKKIPGKLRLYGILIRLFYKLPAKLQYLIVSERNSDVEIAFNRGLSAKILANSANKLSKKIFWIHNDFSKASDALVGFNNLHDAQFNYKKFDTIIGVSTDVINSFKEKLSINTNYKLAYNIIYDEKIYKEGNLRHIDKESDKVIFITVCRLSKEKNIRFLLELFSRFKINNPHFTLWIIGDGPEYENLIKYKNDNHLNNIKFWGSQLNPYPFFKAANVAISSSLYEGMPTSMREAVLFGLPCITTHHAGANEIISSPPGGMILNLDLDEYEKEIIELINDKNKFQYFKNNAKRNAEFHKSAYTIKMNINSII